MRPILLKGRTVSGRELYIRLINAHSQYPPPSEEKFEKMSAMKRQLFDDDSTAKQQLEVFGVFIIFIFVKLFGNFFSIKIS